MSPGLEECVGYGVDSPDGRIGSVVAVLPPRPGQSDGVVLVKTGLLVCSLAAISSAAVESVDTTRRRIAVLGPQVRPEPEPGHADDRALTPA